jgi:hypothetical protein
MDGHTGVSAREIVDTLLDQGQGDGGERLLCRACGHAITSTRERLAVDGAHEHRKTNPGGFTFRIGCFRHAPGAVGWGEAAAEHTWFAGHTWRIALCAGCGVHLGWAFQGEGSRFHGLVLDRLRNEKER